ncbi:DYW domain containing protein [Parasponia andersonii]|uniref:DYW domain containing protein n=1 Tax=Parasponia andersonii TaxID=3476 RepID=A0A2P5D8S9_PARAD|nr:DYW domain containing protein [Parasponia andersonii]
MSPTTITTTSTNLPHHFKPEDFSKESIPTSKLSHKTILDILNKKCTNSSHHLRQAHAVVLKSGHFQDHYVAGTLVKCYANPYFKNLDFALKVFDIVPKPNVFMWNVLIKGCLENNEPLLVVSLYCKMVAVNCMPNKFTLPAVLKACTLVKAVEEGVQVHAHVVKHRFSGDGHVKSAGIQMYASFGCMEEARRVLGEAEKSDVICWNAMIDGCFKFGDIEVAKEVFEKMPRRNVGSWNAMLSGFLRCGMIEAARELFAEMNERDEISWSAIIDGYIKGGYFKEALEVFYLMQREEIKPRKFVLSSVLAACANVGALDQGRWVHAYVKRNLIQLDAVLGTALLDMYAKCGRLDLAWEVFEKMRPRETFTWNAMIGGLAMHGRAEDAIELFFKMQRNKLKPDGITFVNVLNACAHAGLVDEGLRIFSSMKKLYGVEPEVEHYGCIVDLFGRAGLLADAEDFISSMPVRPNAAVFGALLGACRIHGNVELGEKVGKILLELEPHNSGRYALLSNIYAKAGRWKDVEKVRKLMKQRGIRTTHGISMIDLDGTVHEFKMGDSSHPQMKEIYLMLERIIERLQIEGYSPNTSQVLFDISEEEKETELQYHCEKLAIAFGLLNTTPGTTIRIVKNLRVCKDCHSATKLISQIYHRDIIVRDRVRYHHFRNGKCSCMDFW